MDAAATSDEMLAQMSQCAYRLGMAFGAEAERAETFEQRMAFYAPFERCFFAVRVAVALQLRLRRGLPVAAPAEVSELERPEGLERDRAEHERPDAETVEYEAERDREVERASLPVLLRTLEGIAIDAERLPCPPPAALPTLKELLASFTPEAAPPPRSGALRARLAGSATVLATRPAPPGPRPLRSALRGGVAYRRATGPPGR